MVSPSLLLCLVHKTSLSSQHTLAHAHSHRQHKHTRTATHTLCKGFIIAGKIALKYMRLDVTMAEMGREGSKAVELCSPFTLQRHKALLRWRGEHVPRVHIPSAMHRRAPSVTYSPCLMRRLWLLSLKVSQSPFLMHPSLSFLTVCQVLNTSLSQLVWYQHFLTGVYASVTPSKAL